MGGRGSVGDVEGSFSKNQEKKAPHILCLQLQRDPSIQTTRNSMGFPYHSVLVVDLDDDDGGVIPHLVSFPVQLHVVEHQQLVPGWAKGLVENLEKWERLVLLQEQTRILGKGGRWGCCAFFGSERHRESPRDSSEGNNRTGR